jgi:hypothetical protein
MPHVIAAHHLRPRGTLALILATALVGCGGGVTHSEFVARLDETCTRDAARTDQLYAEVVDRLRAHDYPAASRSMQALSVLATVNWLIQRTLKPLAQDAAAFATDMDTQRGFLGVRRRLVAATREADITLMALLFDREQDVRQARLKAAVALGADECGA